MDGTKRKVLIVEDDEFLRALAAKRLEKEGYAVAAAVDGTSALGVAKEAQPDLIVLDLLLPGQDGFEVLEKIKAEETLKAVPVIVFSNLGQKEDIDRANYLGAANFLVKSNFTLDDLIEKVREQLNK
jgi:CheY-like chemotaxis protein